MGTGALWVAGFAALASPFVMAFDEGGSDVTTQAVAAVVAFVLLGVVAVVAPWPLVERGAALAAVVSMAGFAGWTALSTQWSRALGDAVNDADRVVFYAAAFLLAVAAMRASRLRALVPDVLLWGVVVVALYALAGKLLPGVVDVKPEELAGDRLHQPLAYWNAMGIFTGFGVLLGLAAAADGRRPAAYRAAAGAAAVPCALACYLTYSRASWAAVVAGLAVLFLLRTRAGAGPLRTAPRGALAAAAVVLTLAAGFTVSFFAERTEEISKGAARVTTLKTYRGDYWRVALGSFADHPVAGVGAASFQVEWIRERDSRVFAFDAHSLYIETLAELGLVGFLLLAALFGSVAAGLRRRWRAAPDDPLMPAAAAVLGAFAVHAGLDWDWEMPSVTLIALLLAAAVVQRPAERSPAAP